MGESIRNIIKLVRNLVLNKTELNNPEINTSKKKRNKVRRNKWGFPVLSRQDSKNKDFK